MASENLSKKEFKQLRRLHELEASNLEKKQSMVKWIVVGLASTLFLGFFTALVLFAKQSKTTAQAVTLSSAGHMRGNETSPNILVEFGDLQCPACKAYEPMVGEIVKAYDGKVKLLFKHFPLSSAHKFAKEAAIAAEAAGRQNKFWEMHDKLYEKQEEWAVETNPAGKFEQYAKDLKLDVEKFKKDQVDKTLTDIISAQQEEGIAVGVAGTPTFFLNNKKIENPKDVTEFKKLIDKEIKK